ncbi:MAG TPA: glucosidase [Bacteroidetes bacterium]|nr:glucosidase [Bacteroidota bacterium]
MSTKESKRLKEHYSGKKNWLKWGPYLSERQWGTVREDYSKDGTPWKYFPHDHARSRAYRWGEDGIAGICDEQCNICFGIAVWNGKDPFIKERLFGLNGHEGNHGEDVKELYYYLDNTPTHAYMKHLYKYPHAAFPYEGLIKINKRRTREEPEYEILDTGVFEGDKYFDIFTEYAKADDDDILIKITIKNRDERAVPLTVLPTLWLRNLWDFNLINNKPNIILKTINDEYGCAEILHEKTGNYYFYFEKPDKILFAENETNTQRLYDYPNESPVVKDSINDAVISNDFSEVEGRGEGTKFSPFYFYEIKGFGEIEIRVRISKKIKSKNKNPLKNDFDKIFNERKNEADEFYKTLIPKNKNADLANIQRQAFAGMLWSKQYFNLHIKRWLNGDPGQPAPPEKRKKGRNHTWPNLKNEDIISMPDKWEYPWYAAWDLAFHCVPLALLDPGFAKGQLLLFLREWYMHPNGQIPAYEWNLGDVNPPVHAWGCMEVYRIEKKMTGRGDVRFLKRAFHKLLINFTWWVNRKDHNENNVFEGGFLGLDNIGVFDRSEGVPGNGILEQADGTAWMAMYCLNMLDMALEIAQTDDAFEDVATKFLRHFITIAQSLNHIHEEYIGSWDEEEGFFYDILSLPNGKNIPLKIRSLVGLTTMFAVLELDRKRLQKVPEFTRRLERYRSSRIAEKSYLVIEELKEGEDVLLSLLPRKRLEKMLRALLDEKEFLSPNGIRSLSKKHETPYQVNINGQSFGLKYERAESETPLFGGNSNWRGPVWIPMNYLVIQSLRTYHHYYGENLKVECPTGSDHWRHLDEVAGELSRRLVSLFSADAAGHRPAHGEDWIYQHNPHFKNLVLFYEYFDGENGRGAGASHQTGWTGLVAKLIWEGLK